MLADVAYVFTEGTVCISAMASYINTHAAGYLWKLAPATINLIDVENIAGIISSRGGGGANKSLLLPTNTPIHKDSKQYYYLPNEPNIMMAIYILNTTKVGESIHSG